MGVFTDWQTIDQAAYVHCTILMKILDSLEGLHYTEGLLYFQSDMKGFFSRQNKFFAEAMNNLVCTLNNFLLGENLLCSR